MGLRSEKEVLAVAAVNLLTHPVFYGGAFMRFPSFFWRDYGWGLLAAESLVIAIEAALLKFAMTGRKWKELLLISFLMNTGSFIYGVVLLW